MKAASNIFPFVFFIILVLIVVGGAIYASMMRSHRQAELLGLATRLGLEFNPAKDSRFASGWGFLSKLAQGSDRYAFNIMQGDYDGHQVKIFDYHYETGSGKNKHHHYHTFLMLIVPVSFPQLTIGPEHLLLKIAQAFGFEDIDFESAEFSSAFCVRSKDKKFAYDVCHGGMIEYLLANRDVQLEIQGPVLLFPGGRQLSAQDIQCNLRRLLEIRLLLPDYLFTKGGS
jgi:hypothetical protein